jgi:hypothetical protein
MQTFICMQSSMQTCRVTHQLVGKQVVCARVVVISALRQRLLYLGHVQPRLALREDRRTHNSSIETTPVRITKRDMSTALRTLLMVRRMPAWSESESDLLPWVAAMRVQASHGMVSSSSSAQRSAEFLCASEPVPRFHL